jgi:hypothetical protein
VSQSPGPRVRAPKEAEHIFRRRQSIRQDREPQIAPTALIEISRLAMQR